MGFQELDSKPKELPLMGEKNLSLSVTLPAPKIDTDWAALRAEFDNLRKTNPKAVPVKLMQAAAKSDSLEKLKFPKSNPGP